MLKKPARAQGNHATLSRQLIALACIALMLAGPSPLVLADAVGSVIQRVGLTASRLSDAWRAAGARTGARSKQDDPTLNRLLVTKVRVTPQKVLIYEGEGMQINCLTTDVFGGPVNGVALEWTSVNESIATVDPAGEVTAVSPGQTVVQVTAGTLVTPIPVEVRAGQRPVLTDAEWWAEQTAGSASTSAGDSNLDVAFSQGALQEKWRGIYSALLARAPTPAAKLDSLTARFKRGGQNEFRPTIAPTGKIMGRFSPAAVPRHVSPVSALSTRHSSLSTAAAPPLAIDPLIDGSSPDPTQSAGAVSSFGNAVGSPRFYPRAGRRAPSGPSAELLGSANYQFLAPVISLPGRGISANLALVYNSQIWSKDSTTKMSFNSDLGWPTVGWRLGYGRVKHNFDGAGNHLFIEPDGTRRVFNPTADPNVFKTNDGSYLRYNKTNGVMRYHNNTRIKIDPVNNRNLPTQVKTGDGNFITIAYKTYDAVNFPVRWAIDYVRDSLGRYIVFQYDANARLTAVVTSNSQTGSPALRTLVTLSYEIDTINFNFGSMTVGGVTQGQQYAMLKRIYYPETGTGFVMTYGSPYGMCTRISSRRQMTDLLDGVESAYTDYNYPASTATALSDVPTYTQRQE